MFGPESFVVWGAKNSMLTKTGSLQTATFDLIRKDLVDEDTRPDVMPGRSTKKATSARHKTSRSAKAKLASKARPLKTKRKLTASASASNSKNKRVTKKSRQPAAEVSDDDDSAC